jgi:GDP-L-fucose synthase
MPTNLYGPGDNYHPLNSHVLPAMIRRFHEAVRKNASCVTCWGSGHVLREFLHVDDLGEACVFALERWQPQLDDPTFLNVGTGMDLTIRKLAEQVATASGYHGEITWDTSKPDGTPKKQLDVSRFSALGWKARIRLEEGLVSTVNHYAKSFTDLT